MAAIRVLLVDDQASYRKGLVSILAEEPDFELAGEAADGVEALEMTRALMPSVVVMDLSMPRLGGLEATRRIRAQAPCVPIVILTSSDSAPAMEAVRSGARGYLLKSVEPQALVRSLRSVARGKACVSPVMAARLLDELERRGASVVRRAALTAREREVLEQVAQGSPDDRIAEALGIDESTVKNHLTRILEKLHLESRAEGALRALSQRPNETPADRAASSC
jgi:NarL family two-component system response regulator LiaR